MELVRFISVQFFDFISSFEMTSLWNAQRSTKKYDRFMVSLAMKRLIQNSHKYACLFYRRNDGSKFAEKRVVVSRSLLQTWNLQESAWSFFVRFERPKIHRKTRGHFLVVSSVKFLHKMTRGRFLVVPSVVGLARASRNNWLMIVSNLVESCSCFSSSAAFPKAVPGAYRSPSGKKIQL